MLNVRVDRTRCIGAGNCIHIAPTAFDWLQGRSRQGRGGRPRERRGGARPRGGASPAPRRPSRSRSRRSSCPGSCARRSAGHPAGGQDVHVHRHRRLHQPARGARRRGLARPAALARRDAARPVRQRSRARRSSATGDGFFVGFDSPDAALACAVAIQRTLLEHRQKHGFAPQVRIGVHASGATQVGRNFQGKGVHEAARIAALAEGGQILASRETAAGGRYPAGDAAKRHPQGHLRADGGRHGRLAVTPRTELRSRPELKGCM